MPRARSPTQPTEPVADDVRPAISYMICCIRACVWHHKMNVVGRDHVIEHAQTESLLRFEQAVEITASITRKRKVFDRSFWFEQLEQRNAVELLEQVEFS